MVNLYDVLRKKYVFQKQQNKAPASSCAFVGCISAENIHMLRQASVLALAQGRTLLNALLFLGKEMHSQRCMPTSGVPWLTAQWVPTSFLFPLPSAPLNSPEPWLVVQEPVFSLAEHQFRNSVVWQEEASLGATPPTAIKKQ